ncbi:helix-turn-helix transcriptional regulator [Oceanobacillus salinisoli]|uniref:helix-turn-helix transcriptional regulator n=1 Tax=Oceanobacillus salinisoli TaxID=2678611 RepID=UPI0012E2AD3A|nr:helix-turn-helix transcriptional regulator [Oceanobacillus salinisoli]
MKSNINVWIAKSEMSKKEVAEKMEVSQTVLSRWINNKSKPSLEKAFKLAEILDCKVDDLYTKK